MASLLVIALASGGVLGYFLRVYVEQREQQERENVAGALAGVPHHEQVARDLEATAVRKAQEGMSATSEALLDQAANVRRRRGQP